MRFIWSHTPGWLVVASLGCGPAPMPASPVPSAQPAAVVVAPSEASAPRAPAHLVATPMPGEPSTASLTEARLVTTSCDEDKSKLEARVVAMRAAVDAGFKRWRDAQPDCWAEYRRRWEEEKAAAAMGYGGLTLSGIGEGGGFGATIGIGSIGAVGHGGVRVAKSVSRTNGQVEGVDESDLVKTDGRYVYLAVNGALRIVEALQPRVLSVTKLPGVARELFVEGERAVLYTSSGARSEPCTYGYDCVFAGDGSSTHITVLDIARREEPKIVRRIELSGSLMASRRIGATVHTVVADGDSQPMRRAAAYDTWPQDIGECGTPEAKVRAKFAALKIDNERKLRAAVPAFPSMVDQGVTTKLCATLLRSPSFEDGQAYTTVVSFDLTRDAEPPVTVTLESRPGAVYASREALYVAVAHRKGASGGRWYSFASSANEVSDVHKLRIGASPRETRYVGSGVVPGHVLNQLAMDERAGALRIATTRGRVPDPKVESAVSVLAEAPGGSLVRVGAVEHLAPGEDLRAVRFDGDRGYLVTFKKTDPLFVLDLWDPARPTVLGELKIPGFSTYLHRIDRDHLLSIGFDANEHGDFAYFDGVLLQLFDVTRPTEPKLLHRAKLGTRGSSSEAATNHLAFNYLAERGLLAVPMTLCEGGGDGAHGTLAFSGLLLYDVSVEKGFRRLGGVDHGRLGASCETWWSRAESQVKRSVFLDDLVYSVALDRAKVQRMSALGTDLADLALVP